MVCGAGAHGWDGLWLEYRPPWPLGLLLGPGVMARCVQQGLGTATHKSPPLCVRRIQAHGVLRGVCAVGWFSRVWEDSYTWGFLLCLCLSCVPCASLRLRGHGGWAIADGDLHTRTGSVKCRQAPISSPWFPWRPVQSTSVLSPELRTYCSYRAFNVNLARLPCLPPHINCPRSYNALFQFLLRLKRVQLRLEAAWGGLCALVNAPLQRAGA